MMKNFNIYNDPETYGKGEIGEIYVQLDNYNFPEKGWTDFGFNIIFWWLESFIKIHSGELKLVQCDFMDGSYRFDVKRINNLVWNIEFIAERKGDEVWQTGEVDSYKATESLINVADILREKHIEAGNITAAENFRMRIQQLMSLIDQK